MFVLCLQMRQSKVDCYEALDGVVPLLRIMLEDMIGNSQDVGSQVFIQM